MMYIEHDFVRIAKREKNPKRSYLVVNRLQGKHIPVSPQKAFRMFDMLAKQVEEAYGQERLLLIGFAETATAIGARLSVRLNALYMQTTREQIPGAEYLLFLEAHSHAAEQKLVRDGLEEALNGTDRVVFVEDEVTTGNTILNIIQILKQEYPGMLRFAVASLLNGMDPEAVKRYRQEQIALFYLEKTDHTPYAGIAESYAGDGGYFPPDTAFYAKASVCRLHAYKDARQCVQGEAYGRVCEALWEQVKGFAESGAKMDYLVLGTEEFMYPALFVGECLEKCGHTVKFHATTRSPVVVSREEEYPLHNRYELESFYESGRRTFIYDLAKYSYVWIFSDARELQKSGIHSLVNALKLCGNTQIRIFWVQNDRPGGIHEEFL